MEGYEGDEESQTEVMSVVSSITDCFMQTDDDDDDQSGRPWDPLKHIFVRHPHMHNNEMPSPSNSAVETHRTVVRQDREAAYRSSNFWHDDEEEVVEPLPSERVWNTEMYHVSPHTVRAPDRGSM